MDDWIGREGVLLNPTYVFGKTGVGCNLDCKSKCHLMYVVYQFIHAMYYPRGEHTKLKGRKYWNVFNSGL